MKRRICLVLAVLMLMSTVALLSSCNNVDNGDDSVSTNVTTLPDGNGGGNATVDLYADLPTGNYGGYEFKILNHNTAYSNNTIVPEDTQDSLDAAMYARNAFVKENLNINITDNLTNIDSILNALAASNDHEYDLVFTTMQSNALQYIPKQMYLAINEYEQYLDLNKPWWFTDAINSVKLNGVGYQLFGDMHLCYYDSIWTLMFNQSDFTNNKVAFPYDLVRSGNWTIEEMEKIVKATYQKPGEEHYGITSHSRLSIAFIAGCDFDFIEKDEDDALVLFDNEQRLVDVYTAIKDAFYTSNGPSKMNYISFSGDSAAYQDPTHLAYEYGFVERFTRGMSTFLSGTVGDMRPARVCDFDYGYIPFPKYESGQEKYISMIHVGASAATIPATTPDVERTCTILENLMAYSYKLVKYEYYDVLMQGRSVRDNDSIEMLDIIFGVDERGKTMFVLDQVYNIGISYKVEALISDARPDVLFGIDEISGNITGRLDEVTEAYK